MKAVVYMFREELNFSIRLIIEEILYYDISKFPNLIACHRVTHRPIASWASSLIQFNRKVKTELTKMVIRSHYITSRLPFNFSLVLSFLPYT